MPRAALTRRALLGAALCGLTCLAHVQVELTRGRLHAAPVASQRGGRPFVGDRFARTELFFGRSEPDGGIVTDAEWQEFLDVEVTPRFPDGLTVLFGMGQFGGSDGEIEREGSIVLILLYPDGQRDSSARIEQIREAYKRRFHQQSVLRADDRTRVGF